MAQLKCIFCRTPQKGNRDAKAILCGSCVSKLVGSPAAIGKAPKSSAPKVKKEKQVKVAKPASKTAGFGRGWHLKKSFTAPDGTKYSFGKPVKTTKGGK